MESQIILTEGHRASYGAAGTTEMQQGKGSPGPKIACGKARWPVDSCGFQEQMPSAVRKPGCCSPVSSTSFL